MTAPQSAPPNRPLPVNFASIIAELRRRLSYLERRIRDDTTTVESNPPEVLWGINGAVSALRSHDYDVPRAAQLNTLHVSLGTAGSTATTVIVRKNGVQVGPTLTLAAGVTEGEVAINTQYSDGDKLTFVVTSAGTGAAELQASARFG